MKRMITLLLFAAILPAVCFGKGKPVTNPLHGVTKTTEYIDLRSVELTDTATIVKMDVAYLINYWMQLDSLKIVADGKDYALKGSEGFTFGTHIFTPVSLRIPFTVWFEPLPATTRYFDIYEVPDNSPMIRDIPTSRKYAPKDYTSEIPLEIIANSDTKTAKWIEPDVERAGDA